MARGEVARDCKVGEGSTSSGRNSGSSAKRSSKSTSDRTLLESRQGHFLCPRLQLPLSQQPAHSARSPSRCSLVHRVKGLLQGRGPHLHLLAGTSCLLALRGVPGRPPTAALTAAAAATRSWGWSQGRAGRGGGLPSALQAQPRDTPV